MLVIGARHPRILARLLPGLADPHGALGPPCTRAAAHAEATLRAAGFTAPPWAALVHAAQASDVSHFGDVARGWQQAACSIRRLGHCCCLKRGRAAVLFVLATLPTREEFTVPDDVASCVLLRRLRLPLPLSSRLCRCGGELVVCSLPSGCSGELAQGKRRTSGRRTQTLGRFGAKHC